MPARVRTPSPAKNVAIEFTVAEFGRACGWSRQTALRRLKDAGVVLRRRGVGTTREHYAVTLRDIVASDLAWVKESIDFRRLLIERTKRPHVPEETDDDD